MNDKTKYTKVPIKKEREIKCEFAENTGDTCAKRLNCCDCGGNDCGCRYCWSCNACEHCLRGD